MDTDNATFVSAYRCLNCEGVLGYLLDMRGQTMLRLYDEQGYRQFVNRAPVECGRCGARRDFAT